MCALSKQHQSVAGRKWGSNSGEKILAYLIMATDIQQAARRINRTHEMTPYVVGANWRSDLPDELARLTPEQAYRKCKRTGRAEGPERSIRQSKREFLHVAGN